MKSLTLLFVLFSLFNSVHAENLCDASCEFSATFPQGGSLEAIDELALTFGAGGELILGTGGTVNTAIQPSSLDFSSGGTLFLSAGESITFGPGGSLILGAGGNIDALNYNLSTTGDITIGATGSNQAININGDLGASGVLSFTSNSLEINSTITAGNQLNLANSTTISGSGSITVPESTTLTVENVVIVPSGSLSLSSGSGVINNASTPFNLSELTGIEISNSIIATSESVTLSAGNVVTFPEWGMLVATDELTLTFGAGGELILGTGGTVNTAIQPSSLDFSSGGTLLLSAGESIKFGPGGSIALGTGGNIDSLNYNLITTGKILQNLDPINGIELLTSDGNKCIVTSPECVADDGTIYVLSTEGELVKKEAPSDNSTSGKSGAFGLPFLGFFMILLFLSGSRKTLKS